MASRSLFSPFSVIFSPESPLLVRFCVQAKKAVVKQSPGHVQMTDAQAKFFEYNVRKEEAERVRVFLGGHGTSKPSPIVSARVSH